MRESAAAKAECVFLPPLVSRAVCLLWHSTALRTRQGKAFVDLSEHETRWKLLKPGIEMKSALSTGTPIEEQVLQNVLQQLHTLIVLRRLWI